VPAVSISERIARAALEQFSDTGIRRTSVEDVAKRAGLSRVTVYRHVGGKDRLVQLVIATETRRAMAQLDATFANPVDPATALEAGFSFLVRFVRDHPLFDRLLRTEPELLLPALTVNGGPFLALYRGQIAERLTLMRDRGTIAPGDVDRASEAIARLAISLILIPDGVVNADDPDAVAAFARETLLPLLRAPE